MIEVDDEEFRAAQADALAEAEEAAPSRSEAEALLLAQNEAEAEDLDEWRQEEFMTAVNAWAAGSDIGEGGVEIPYDLWSRGSDAEVDAYLVRKYRAAHRVPVPPAAPKATPMPKAKPAAPAQRRDSVEGMEPGFVTPRRRKDGPNAFKPSSGPPIVHPVLPQTQGPIRSR